MLEKFNDPFFWGSVGLVVAALGSFRLSKSHRLILGNGVLVFGYVALTVFLFREFPQDLAFGYSVLAAAWFVMAAWSLSAYGTPRFARDKILALRAVATRMRDLADFPMRADAHRTIQDFHAVADEFLATSLGPSLYDISSNTVLLVTTSSPQHIALHGHDFDRDHARWQATMDAVNKLFKQTDWVLYDPEI